MKKYEAPKLEVIELAVEDIMFVSSEMIDFEIEYGLSEAE